MALPSGRLASVIAQSRRNFGPLAHKPDRLPLLNESVYCRYEVSALPRFIPRTGNGCFAAQAGTSVAHIGPCAAKSEGLVQPLTTAFKLAEMWGNIAAARGIKLKTR
jgi:hypothetical protein